MAASNEFNNNTYMPYFPPGIPAAESLVSEGGSADPSSGKVAELTGGTGGAGMAAGAGAGSIGAPNLFSIDCASSFIFCKSSGLIRGSAGAASGATSGDTSAAVTGGASGCLIIAYGTFMPLSWRVTYPPNMVVVSVTGFSGIA